MRSPVGLPAWVSSVSVWVVVDVGQPRGSKRVGVQVVRVGARHHRQTSLRSSVEPSLAGAREDDRDASLGAIARLAAVHRAHCVARDPRPRRGVLEADIYGC